MTMPPSDLGDRAALLAAYDAELRGSAELPPGEAGTTYGPLVWGHFGSDCGFVTYRSLEGHRHRLGELVGATLDHFRADPAICRVEWKTRGHDHAPELHATLLTAGFVPDDLESVMIGRCVDLVADVRLPDGVALRRLTEADDVRRMCAMADAAFGRVTPGAAQTLLDRLALGGDDLELWVAEADGVMVSAGRLEPVAGTRFAGLWGGCTLSAWRGRGIYRALTAERARSALRRGMTLLQSDSTEYSRPILERSGLVKVTTTTPYEWTRPPTPG